MRYNHVCLKILLKAFLLILILGGCHLQESSVSDHTDETTNLKTEIVYERIKVSYGEGFLCCLCDFESDGTEEEIICDYSDVLINGNTGIGTIEVKDVNNQVIWTDTYALPYQGYKKIYISVFDDNPYLIEYLPAHNRQGEWIGSISIFDFSEDNEIRFYKRLSVSGTEDSAKEFEAISQEYIEEATLLVSTYGGRLIYYKYLG